MSELEAHRKTRRELLGLLGGLGAAAFVASCGGNGGGQTLGKASGTSTSTSTSTTSAAATTTTAATAVSSCSKIPEETAGPYPGDGSNGPNVLNQTGVVRSDIRSSFGSSSTVAKGVPLTLNVVLYDSKNGCKVMSGAAVYVWHCDINGS